MAEPKTFINVPMADSQEERFRKEDRFWDGPKLIVLTAVTLGIAWTILYLSAHQIIGPTFYE